MAASPRGGRVAQCDARLPRCVLFRDYVVMPYDSTPPPGRAHAWSVAPELLATRRQISQWAGVSRVAVTNWQRRHPDFPQPKDDGGMERFSLSEVLAWLSARRVPAAQRRGGEPEGITYADRVRRAVRPGTSQDSTTPRHGGESEGTTDAGRVRRAVEPGTSRGSTTEEILTELFGPLGRRVRGSASAAVYLHLVTGLLFLRHSDPASWAGLRDDVHAASDRQSDPQRLIRRIGGRIEAARAAQGLPSSPGKARTSFAALGGPAAEDLGQIMRRCEDLPRTVFGDLLRHYELWDTHSGPPATTPRSLVELIMALFVRAGDQVHLHDPYARAGEMLLGAWKAAGSVTLSGSGADPDLCRLAEMGIRLSGGQARLTPGSPTPWREAPAALADLIVTNPPFNATSTRAPYDTWLFDPPPAHNDNYAWLQHVLASLAPGGKAGVVMPNRAAASDDDREQRLRQHMLDTGTVEFIVALPRQLFAPTRVAAMLWGLRAPGTRPGDDVLFLEVHGRGQVSGQQRILTTAEISTVVACLEQWRACPADLTGPTCVTYEGVSARAVPRTELAQHGYSLDPADHLAARTAPDRPASTPHRPIRMLEEQLWLAERADAKVQDISVDPGVTTVGDHPPGWSTVPLKELCDLQSGPSHQTARRLRDTERGLGLVAPRDLVDRRVRTDTTRRIHPEQTDGMSRFTLRENDILFVRTGTVGPLARVDAAQQGWLLGTNLMRLRAHDGVDPAYLLAVLSARAAQSWIARRAQSATAIPSISTSTLGSLRLPRPPLSEQQRIGAVLTDLDNQIIAHRALADAADRLRTDLADHLTTGLLTTTELR